MISTSPAILPVSNPQYATVSPVPSESPIATSAFRSFINNISITVRNGLSQRRPWFELIDSSAFSRPDSFSDAATRVRKNYSYFRVNYISFVAVVVAFSFITNPFSLILLSGLLASWIFLYLFRPSDSPLIIFGRTFSDRETLGLLVALSVVVIFLTSVGSVLISALLAGFVIVFAHGAFRNPEVLFLDEQEPASLSGFMSFLGGAAAPIVASRV